MNITKRQRWLIVLLILISVCLFLFFSLSWGGKAEKKIVLNSSPEKMSGEDLKQLQVVLSGVTVNSAPKAKPVKLDNPKPPVSEKAIAKKTEPVAVHSSSHVSVRAIPVFSEAAPHHYIIQLIAGSELRSILQYMKTHKLQGKARWYRTSLEGQMWYVLAYGHYSSKAEASAALKALPLSLRTKGPFIKPLSSVQAAIKRAQ